MKARDYCCCAIPVVNFGIYLTLTEQFALGIVAGTLSIGTPNSNNTPVMSCSIAKSSLCSRRCFNSFVCSLDFCRNLLCRRRDSNSWFYRCCQGSHSSSLSISLVAHFERIQEKAVLFRRYTTLHGLITVAAFSIAAVWIGLSASRHKTAKSNCEQKFFTAVSDLTSEGETMCEIFPWVDIGVMGALWVLLAISQVCYLVVVPGAILTRRRRTSLPSFPDMAPANAETTRNLTPFIP
jgi:hypothetical protein